jgi:hypothetical protein
MTDEKFEAFLRMNDAEGEEFMRGLDPDDLATLERMVDDEVTEFENIADPNAKALASVADEIANPGTWAKKPAPSTASPAAPPAAPKPVLGMGKDGIYRCTEAQFRNPAWCYRTQTERLAAKGIETVPE